MHMIDPTTAGTREQFEWTEEDITALRVLFSELAGKAYTRTGHAMAFLEQEKPVQFTFADGVPRTLVISYGAAMIQKCCSENGDPLVEASAR